MSLPTGIISTLTAAGLPSSQILAPASAEYMARQESYWSNSASSLTPGVIIRPRSAADVSVALVALVANKIPFAVRSGGHMPHAGANNISGPGVTMDLGLLDWVRLNLAEGQAEDGQRGGGRTRTVDIGPGARWGQVYAALQELEGGRYAVNGGRDAGVGVAGLLLGGGMTFFTAKRGFACDDVVAYELVLADGSIVTVTADRRGDDGDLFRALKGGSGNFGIVTGFRVRAFELGPIWGGLTFYPEVAIPDTTAALVEFTDAIQEDVDSNVLCFYTYTPESKEIVVAAAFINVAGLEEAAAYAKWLALPSTMSTCNKTNLLDITTEYGVAPRGFYNTYVTATFKNDPRIVTEAAELHARLVADARDFIPDGNFITQCLFQPLPRIMGQRSAAAGGNMLGLDKQPVNGLLFTAVAQVQTAEQDGFARPRVRAWVQQVRDFAATLEDNGNLDWVYANYADSTQDPLASYGVENVETMRRVALGYDPRRVFQTLCPGGFKIPSATISSI